MAKSLHIWTNNSVMKAFRKGLLNKIILLAVNIFLVNAISEKKFPHCSGDCWDLKLCFLKPFLKGKILRSGEWERGKFDFDHYFAFLTNFLQRDRICCLVASDSARREDYFQKRICPKRTFPSNFVKLVSKILYLFLAEKMVVCCLLLLLLFVAIFCPILAYFFFNWSLCQAEKDAFKEKIIPCTVWELLNP